MRIKAEQVSAIKIAHLPARFHTCLPPRSPLLLTFRGSFATVESEPSFIDDSTNEISGKAGARQGLDAINF
jgi:hypothetical protein